jgi:hypothetical protein
LLGVVDGDFSQSTVTADAVLLEKKFIVVELMFVTGFTSIHFVKYSIAIIAKV